MKRAEGAYGGQLPEVLELVCANLHMQVELHVELHDHWDVELHVGSPCTCMS